MKKFLILVIVLLILVLNLPAAQWQWLSSAKLLSRNDKPPTIYFGYPKISISNHSVYVVWSDFRNGRSDIYFNYSHDKGAKWQLFDIRLYSGDLAGRSSSYYPQISSSGNYVYVVWSDFRNGPSEIYINYG